MGTKIQKQTGKIFLITLERKKTNKMCFAFWEFLPSFTCGRSEKESIHELGDEMRQYAPTSGAVSVWHLLVKKERLALTTAREEEFVGDIFALNIVSHCHYPYHLKLQIIHIIIFYFI